MANRESAFIDITPEVLLKAYACGIFPMAESADDPALYWIEPEKRGIIPLDRFHVPARLARTVRSDRFSVTVNRDFDGVIEGCAEAVRAGNGPKGEVLATARLAGIQAAKATGQLIPLAHPLPLSFIDLRARIEVEEGLVELTSEVRTVARTGVEMEAMTACAVGALTVYDMVKGLERGVQIEQVVLLEKRGGRSDYLRAEQGGEREER